MNKMSIILLSCAVLISTSTVAWIINSNHHMLFPYDIMNVPLVPPHWNTISIDDIHCHGKRQSPIAIESIPCTTYYDKYIFRVCNFAISEDDVTLIL